jgi:hypothetical protein
MAATPGKGPRLGGVDKADALTLNMAKYPKEANFRPRYGTAGFRASAHLMLSTTFRCGMIAALRAMQTRKRVGIMITASHNPECDNGIKLVDPSGGASFQICLPSEASGL